MAAAPAKTPARAAPKRAAAAKKAAPRTKGTPAKPPAPRKVTAAAKPRSKPASRTDTPAEPRWEPAQPGWQPAPAPPGPQWIPLPAPTAAPAGGAPPTGWAQPAFDLRTGAWVPAVNPPDASTMDPAALHRGTRAIVMHVILGLALAFLALNFIAQIVIGAALLWAPDSAFSEDVRDLTEGAADSPGEIIGNALLTFLLVGVIPFLWVLGTRVVPWRGLVRFLDLRARPKDFLRGAALVPLMIAAVYALVVAYTCAIDGCGALDDEPEDGSALDEMLNNLTWPVVITVALAAGIGEEILFRGVLQRWIGIWGQGVAFGLAHAVNAYPPQVLFAFGLGVVFGYLYKRGWSLVSLMVAHFLYDFVLLALAMLYPEFG